MRSVTIISSPYHVGIRDHRVGDGPNRILQLGLVQELQKLHLEVYIHTIKPVDDFEGEIGRCFEILRRTSTAVSEARKNDSFPLILAGNCMSIIGVASGLGIDDLGFVFFDAHDDIQTPDTMTSGYFDAMGLSILGGRSWKALAKTIPGFQPRNYDKFVYCGLRDVQEGSVEVIRGERMEVVWGGTERKSDFVRDLSKKLKEKKIRDAIVHVDLDVLDESVGKANEYAAPGGMSEEDLVGCLGMVPGELLPVSLSICSFNPHLGGGDDIARIAIRAAVAFFRAIFEHRETGTRPV